MTATEASRHFSELLDVIQAGHHVTITRGSIPVAEIGPSRAHTGAALAEALRKLDEPVDDTFATDVRSAREFVVDELRNPWGDE